MKKIIEHYDLLIDENNDPVNDPFELQEYMDKWDGPSFLSELNLDENKDVLEIGVGTGRLAIKVINNCKSFTGIDVSKKTIERAYSHLHKFSPILICDDFLDYHFDEKYDVIYSSLTFMHFKDKGKVLNKIYNILKDDGRVVISISKDQNNIIDYGSRQIEIYPINKYGFLYYIYEQDFKLEKTFEVEFANIFVLRK